MILFFGVLRGPGAVRLGRVRVPAAAEDEVLKVLPRAFLISAECPKRIHTQRPDDLAIDQCKSRLQLCYRKNELELEEGGLLDDVLRPTLVVETDSR